jgi:hypothetical protein
VRNYHIDWHYVGNDSGLAITVIYSQSNATPPALHEPITRPRKETGAQNHRGDHPKNPKIQKFPLLLLGRCIVRSSRRFPSCSLTLAGTTNNHRSYVPMTTGITVTRASTNIAKSPKCAAAYYARARNRSKCKFCRCIGCDSLNIRS